MKLFLKFLVSTSFWCSPIVFPSLLVSFTSNMDYMAIKYSLISACYGLIFMLNNMYNLFLFLLWDFASAPDSVHCSVCPLIIISFEIFGIIEFSSFRKRRPTIVITCLNIFVSRTLPFLLLRINSANCCNYIRTFRICMLFTGRT